MEQEQPSREVATQPIIAPSETASEPTSENIVKDFSREHSTESRQDLADQIRSLRQQYFNRATELGQSGQETEKQKAAKEALATEGATEVERLQLELDYKESSVINRLLHFRAIPRLEQQLELTQSQLAETRVEIEELGGILAEFGERQADRSELKQAREMLEGFYSGESVKYREYLEGQEAAKVENICDKYNCLIMHGFLPNRVPGDNSLLKEETSWQDKMKIVMALKPGLSTSTFHGEYQPLKTLWSPVGVVISEGRVDHASDRDLATKPFGATRQSVHGPARERISEQIQKAIVERRPGGHYNELVVSEPKIAALYYIVDTSPESANIPDVRYVRTHLQNFVDQSYATKVPLVVFMNGDKEWRQLTGYNSETDEMEQVNQVIDQAAIRHLPTGLSDERCQTLETEILSGNIFDPQKVGGQEISFVHDRLKGYEEGLRLQLEEGKFTSPSREVLQEQIDGYSFIKTGEEINVVKRLQMFGTEHSYFYLDRNPAILYELLRSPKGYLGFNSISKNWANMIHTFQGSVSLNREPENSHDLIELIREKMADIDTEMSETQDNPKYEENQRQRYLNDSAKRQKSLAYYLYGLAESFREQGDEELANFVLEKAAVVVPPEIYQDVLNRRLSPNGELILTKDDIFVRPER